MRKMHIQRQLLPWRKSDTAACGNAGTGRVLTREEYLGLRNGRPIREVTDTMIGVCSVCGSLTRAGDRIDTEHPGALVKLVEHEASCTGHGAKQRLNAELRALAELAKRHPEEFQQIADADLVLASMQHPELFKRREKKVRKIKAQNVVLKFGANAGMSLDQAVAQTIMSFDQVVASCLTKAARTMGVNRLPASPPILKPR